MKLFLANSDNKYNFKACKVMMTREQRTDSADFKELFLSKSRLCNRQYVMLFILLIMWSTSSSLISSQSSESLFSISVWNPRCVLGFQRDWWWQSRSQTSSAVTGPIRVFHSAEDLRCSAIVCVCVWLCELCVDKIVKLKFQKT